MSSEQPAKPKKRKIKKKKLVSVESTTNNESAIKTNENGLSYEGITDLNDKITISKESKTLNIIKFNGNEKSFRKTKRVNLFKCMKDEINKDIAKSHGCKNPDECYIDE